MTISEATELCERAAEKCLGPPTLDSGGSLTETVLGEQDCLATAFVVLPRLRALQKALAEAQEFGIVAGYPEVTPFMQNYLERIRFPDA